MNYLNTRNPCEELKKKDKYKLRRIFCFLTIITIGVTPAWASGIGDILLAVFGGLIVIIAQFILGLMEIAAGLFLKAMSIDITTLNDKVAILAAFDFFADGIRLLSVFLAGVITLWHLFAALWGPLFGIKQTQSVGSTIIRALVFIPGCYIVQPLAMAMFRELQKIYNAFLAVNNNSSNIMLSQFISPEIILSLVGTDITTGIAAPLQDAAAILISSTLVIIITWNFVKFLLEMTQRFVVMIVYAYLSPLACACAVTPTGEGIAKKGMTLFLSSGILWVLNVWCVGIGLKLFAAVQSAIYNVATFFLWALVTYGYFKIIQQLDDIFNAVGATNVRLSGSMLEDLVSMNGLRNAVDGFSKTFGNFRNATKNFAENGFFAAKGSTSGNPVTPQAGKISNMTGKESSVALKQGSMGENMPVGEAGSGPINPQGGQSSMPKIDRLNMQQPQMATMENGAVPRTLGQQATNAAKTAVKNTTPVRLYEGTVKTVGNIQNIAAGHMAESRMASGNQALSHVYDALSRANSEQRNARMKKLAATSPEIFSNNAVKQYVGDSLGLEPNQQVAGLNIDKDGMLSATVISSDNSGKVTMNKVNDVGQTIADEITGETKRRDPKTFSADELSSMGMEQAKLSFTDRQTGETITGQLARNENDSDLDHFVYSFTPNMGDPEMNEAFKVNIAAPKDMSAAEVGSVLVGAADTETTNRFIDGGGNKREFDVSSSRDTSIPGAVEVGGSMINSSDTGVTIRGHGGEGSLDLKKVSSDGEHDHWSAYSKGDYLGDMEFVSGTGAKEVAEKVLYGEGESYDSFRQAAAIQNEAEYSEVTFTSAHTGEGISAYSTVIESESVDISHAGSQFTYQRIDDLGNTIEEKGYITPTGHSSSDGIEYQFGTEGKAHGVVSINANITPEELAAALAHENGLGIEGIRKVRESLGIKNALTDNETKNLRHALVKARQSRAGTEDHPIGE